MNYLHWSKMELVKLIDERSVRNDEMDSDAKCYFLQYIFLLKMVKRDIYRVSVFHEFFSLLNDGWYYELLGMPAF